MLEKEMFEKKIHTYLGYWSIKQDRFRGSQVVHQGLLWGKNGATTYKYFVHKIFIGVYPQVFSYRHKNFPRWWICSLMMNWSQRGTWTSQYQNCGYKSSSVGMMFFAIVT